MIDYFMEMAMLLSKWLCYRRLCTNSTECLIGWTVTVFCRREVRWTLNGFASGIFYWHARTNWSLIWNQSISVYYFLDSDLMFSVMYSYILIKDLTPEVREAQEKKLDGFKKQQDIHNRLAVERKIFLRDRKIKFFGKDLCFMVTKVVRFSCQIYIHWVAQYLSFWHDCWNYYLPCLERRKIERRIRRLEKMQRTSSGQSQEADIAEQLSKLKEDLEYVRVYYKLETLLPLAFSEW